MGLSSKQIAQRGIRGIIYQGITQYGVLALGLIKTPIIARLVAPEMFGVVALASTWTSFLNLFRMELREVVISDPENSPTRLTAQYVVEVASTLIGFVIALIFRFLFPDTVSSIVWIAIFALLGIRTITSLTSTPLYMLHRDIKQAEVTRLTLIGAVLAFIATVLTAYLGYPLMSLLLDLAIPVFVLGIGSWIIVGWRPTWNWEPEIGKDVLSFGMTLWTGGLLGKVMWELDDWLVGTLRGERALGFYSKAYNLSKMPMDVLGGMIGSIALSLYAQSELAGREILERTYQLITWLLSRIVAISTIVMLAAAEEIVMIFLGPQWGSVPGLVRLMFIYVLGRPLFQNNAQLLLSLREEKKFRVTLVVQAVILIIVCPFAVLYWGAKGASVAVSIMQIVGFAWSQWYVNNKIDASVLNLYILPLLLVLILSPAAYILGNRVTDNIVVSLLLKSGGTILVFGVVLIIFERDKINEGIKLLMKNLTQKDEAQSA